MNYYEGCRAAANCEPGEEQITIIIKHDQKQKANFRQMKKSLKNINHRRRSCGDLEAKFSIQCLPDESDTVDYLKKRAEAWQAIQK